ALMSAAEAGRSDFARLLLEHGADINAKDNSDKTALMYAAGWVSTEREYYISEILLEKGSDVNVSKILLEKGADVNAKDSSGQTALMFASSKKHVDLVELLLEKSADVRIKNNSGKTALRLALEQGIYETEEDIKLLKLLLSYGADVNARIGESGSTILMFAAEKGYRAKIVSLLLKQGADVNARDNSGRTPLMFAASSGIAEVLLDHGADINAKDNNGMTALMIHRNDVEIRIYLENKGAK
ncbi:MAG: ankyrin repeat domain-containing protein, partial [Akkermansia sp.]